MKTKSQSVGRTTERAEIWHQLSAVRCTDYRFIFASADPTDESVGYFHSSAKADSEEAQYKVMSDYE